MTKEEQEILEQAEQIKKKEASKTKAAKTKKRKGTYSKLSLLLVAAYVIYFNERVFGLLSQGVIVSETQIDKTLTCLLGEVIVLAIIKLCKIRKDV